MKTLYNQHSSVNTNPNTDNHDLRFAL